MAKTESVTAQMKEVLDEINDDVRKSAKRNIDRVSKESVQKLKNTSPVKSGSYAKGWWRIVRCICSLVIMTS